ncbi:HesB/IscA family protein [Methanosalsum natronophilum]|uniref:Iron-sulfur cluster assembly accessory protein n=1 Tax=Methanosalsum natronophilum TaxID=768733 RepID=A0A3R7XGS9_9EURY|nr:iron-sulfur cluster assembly accessory protein [Methanosalsum natronophilum]MCS3924332.1 iron-sulfur cluster assembly accessory protein [Methanosalsum natronophilum]RQD82954.1 MAG: iron-sulfur cluster assembly accessory protein [Methanosalsum natronophilum]
MIEITDAAADELRSIIEKEEKDSHSLRIFVAGMGCSGIQYGLALDDDIKDEDVTIESKDIKIVMDREIVGGLTEATIDFIDTPQGKGFVIDNPKAASECGTGCQGCE